MCKISRRDSLKASLLASAAPAFYSSRAWSAHFEPIRIGLIGVGNRGAANLAAVGHEQVVALCDVDDRYLKNAAKQYQDAATFRDYKEMLEADLDLDAGVLRKK